MNQVKLNLLHPISSSSGSSASVFPFSGVMSEGPEEVCFLKTVNFVDVLLKKRDSDLSGRETVTETSLWRKLFASDYSFGIFYAMPRMILPPKSVMLL